MFAISLLLLLLMAPASAQQAGTAVKEEHPEMPLWMCTAAGCVKETKSVTLDANWRWVHDAQNKNCYTGTTWDDTLCPDPATCVSNCMLEGVSSVQYQQTYGVSSVESGISLRFVTQGPYSANYGSRLYLMESSSAYKIFKLKNREFTFTVDLSRMPCGLNGAVYFVEMEADGGIQSSGMRNGAGAKYGTGYCDAQCPHDLKFVAGQANVNSWHLDSITGKSTGKFGSCCSEFDIWEANSRAAAFTAHPCKVNGSYTCEGQGCVGLCDKSGCDFNSYRLGNQSFFGRGSDFVLDTKKELTVVTQFITDDGTDTGKLVDVRRFYIQEDTVIPNSKSSVRGIHGNSINNEFCNSLATVFGNVNDFALKGGLEKVGQAMDSGMALVFSIWDDSTANMLWLDSSYPVDADSSQPGVARGPCRKDTGSPLYVRTTYPTASVAFTRARFGSLGSTFNLANDPFGNDRRLTDL